METKHPLKSKRFWGMILLAIGKTFSSFPQVAEIGYYLSHAGEALLGVGMMTASQPLVTIKKDSNEPTEK